MKKIFISIIVVSFIFPGYAQTWGWVRTAGGINQDYGGGLLIDRDENVYVSGNVMNPSVIFGNYPIGVSGFCDGFVAKYNSAGVLQWVNVYGGHDPFAKGDGAVAWCFNKDTSSIYICGTFWGECYIGSYKLTAHSQNDRDALLAQIDLDGNCLWAKSMGGYGERDGMGIYNVDTNGNLLVRLDFELSGMVDTFHIPRGEHLACLDSLGNCLWFKSITTNISTGVLRPWESDYFLVGGIMDDIFSIDTINYHLPGYYGLVLARLDSNFHSKWVLIFAGPDKFTGARIFQTESGDITLLGVSEGPYTTFGNDTLFSVKDFTFYMARYDQNGGKKWIRTFESDYPIGIRQLIIDEADNIYTAGSFYDTINLGNGFFTIPNSVGSPELFIAKFDSTGLCQDLIYFGKSEGANIGFAESGTIYLSGTFRDPCVIGDTLLTSYGNNDVFVAQLLNFNDIYYPNPGGDQLLIYANPTAGSCNIQIPEEFLGESNLLLSIFGLDGKIIQQQNIIIAENKILLDIEARAKGVYVATLSNGKKVYTGKIVFE